MGGEYYGHYNGVIPVGHAGKACPGKAGAWLIAGTQAVCAWMRMPIDVASGILPAKPMTIWKIEAQACGRTA